MIRTLRTRLLLGTVLATACIFLIAAILLYAVIRRSLVGEFDATLLARARALTALTEQGDGGIRVDLDVAQAAEYRRGPQSDYFVMTDERGAVLAQSDSLRGSAPGSLGLPAATDRMFLSATLPDGRPGRKIALCFAPRGEEEEHRGTGRAGRTATLVVARDAGELNARLARLAWLLAGTFAAAALAAAAVMSWVVGHGLRPLHRLAEKIEALGGHLSSGPIALYDAPTEMKPVIERLNELLAGLEASFARERAFTADAAHELRTPLAGLTTALQVCLAQRRPPEEYERIAQDCLKVTTGMRTMIENLLLLARADAEQITPRCAPMDLGALLADLWQACAPGARERQLSVVWSAAPELPLVTDKELVALVLRNLLDNAVSHSNAGGNIAIQAEPLPQGARVRIRNSGSAVAAQEAAKVFERFWRADAARRATGRHCGLGLALCRRIVALLGGQIAVETVQGGDFTVTVELPTGD